MVRLRDRQETTSVRRPSGTSGATPETDSSLTHAGGRDASQCRMPGDCRRLMDTPQMTRSEQHLRPLRTAEDERTGDIHSRRQACTVEASFDSGNRPRSDSGEAEQRGKIRRHSCERDAHTGNRGEHVLNRGDDVRNRCRGNWEAPRPQPGSAADCSPRAVATAF